MSLMAASLSFFLLLAVFPALGAGLSLYGLMGNPAALAHELTMLRPIMPESAYRALTAHVMAVSQEDDSTLGLGIAAGTTLALWSCSRAAVALMMAMNVAFGFESRTHRMKAAFGFATVGLGLLLGALLVVASPLLVERLHFEQFAAAVRWSRWPLLALLLFTALAILYYRVPNAPRQKVIFFSRGALAAVACWFLIAGAFASFSRALPSFGYLFGPLAGGIALMVWLYVSSYVLCVGAVANALRQREYMQAPPR